MIQGIVALMLAAGLLLQTATAQTVTLAPSDFTREYKDQQSGIDYSGDGKFVDIRWCRGGRLDVHLSRVEYDCASKTVILEGRVVSTQTKESIGVRQVVLGGPLVSTSEDPEFVGPLYQMDIRQRFRTNDSGWFQLTLGPIGPDDLVAFTALESSADNGVMESLRSVIFAIGKLTTQHPQR